MHVFTTVFSHVSSLSLLCRCIQSQLGTSETALLIEKGNYSFAFFLIYFSFVLSDPIDIDEVLARIAILGK